MLSPLLESERILFFFFFFFEKKGLDLIKTKVLHPAPDRAPLKERKIINESTEGAPRDPLPSPTVVAASQIFLTSRNEEDPG